MCLKHSISGQTQCEQYAHRYCFTLRWEPRQCEQQLLAERISGGIPVEIYSQPHRKLGNLKAVCVHEQIVFVCFILCLLLFGCQFLHMKYLHIYTIEITVMSAM